ncbi:MAG: PD-(D/E)XK nuclease family protein [Capnocytophaga sp.]|nr:PD-(D/E)XK nuclease family protein [Capnocytophaga sp.]
METSFLKEVVVDVLARYAGRTSDLIFVVPGKRASLFLKNYYAESCGKSGLAPQFITIESLLLQIARMRKAQGLELLFELYDTYRTHCKTEPDDFETFAGWGQTLLRDFNEIDQYLVNPEKIFPYIHAIKEAEHWSGADELTEMQRKHLEFWNALGGYYFAFQQKMLGKGSGYAGMIAKQAVRHLPDYIRKHTDAIYIFAGFNALSGCEQKIIQTLLAEATAEIYWDVDRYFVETEGHDAGLFIRNYLKNWAYYRNHKPKWLSDVYRQEKTIHITGVPKSINQAHEVSHLIGQMPVGILAKTALVMADEQLLLPMVQSVNVSVPMNITMGYPLQQTPMNDLFAIYFRLHLSKSYYYKDIIQLLTNPMLQELLPKEVVNHIVTQIHQRNSNYLSRNKLFEMAPPEYQELLADLIPDISEQPVMTLVDHALRSIIRFKKVADQNRTQYGLWLEYAYRFHQLFLQLKQLQAHFGHIQSVKTLYHFYLDILQKDSLDFVGEPLEGLQLMGVLESRNLDFEHLIITSVNEGVLPSGKSGNSFIPYDVKRNVGLPTYKERDAIYSYHFYRLIQRAKTVHLLYDTDTDSLKGKEKSRFILQLLAENIPAHSINHQIKAPEVHRIEEKKISIPKDEDILQRLKEVAASGFSSSALTTYVFNPVTFYQQYILGVKEEMDVEESIEARTFGNIVHHVLEELYKPLIGIVLTIAHYVEMKKQVPLLVQKYFSKEYRSDDYQHGKNLLAYTVIMEYIYRFLEMEKEEVGSGVEIIVQQVEQKITVPLENHTIGYEVNLKGVVDRVDRRNGKLYIIDYKTGVVGSENVGIYQWESLINDFKHSKAYQLLTYAYLYKKLNAIDEEIIAGNISFKRLRNGLLTFRFKENKLAKDERIDDYKILKFEEVTSLLLNEIFNMDIPFEEKQIDQKGQNL